MKIFGQKIPDYQKIERERMQAYQKEMRRPSVAADLGELVHVHSFKKKEKKNA